MYLWHIFCESVCKNDLWCFCCCVTWVLLLFFWWGVGRGVGKGLFRWRKQDKPNNRIGYISIRRHGTLFTCCDGLTLVICQPPTQPLSYSLSSTRWRRELWKFSWLEIKTGNLSIIVTGKQIWLAERITTCLLGAGGQMLMMMRNCV